MGTSAGREKMVEAVHFSGAKGTVLTSSVQSRSKLCTDDVSTALVNSKDVKVRKAWNFGTRKKDAWKNIFPYRSNKKRVYFLH